MLVIYDAANLIDAHLVRHALEDAGIPAFVRGEALMGGVGELPAFGVVQVCVPESAQAEAAAIVQALGFGEGPPPEPDADALPQPA
ncbi:putative signal transducing protein [Lysobacter humi (ex Lee et al. 2017)]